MKRSLIALVTSAILTLAGTYYYARARDGHAALGNTKFRTAKVDRGEVVEGVQASGTVQPVLLVQVGSQISGVIDDLFHIDFNSKVKAGQKVAHLDSRRLAAQVKQDEANIQHAKADLERVKALTIQAEKDLERDKILAQKNLLGQADLDAALAARDSLRAQIGLAEASVLQAEAQLDQDKVNFEYATILSPIDGVVVSRNVDVGQTVAASLQAPTIFVIANDLTKMQVWASVPEADIGKIHEKQPVVFTVDAHSEKSFGGVVSQVRLNSTTVQNVVTYTVIVDADNPDGLLLPGMTANATFEVARSKPEMLKVPASALRLQPPKELLEQNVVQAQQKPDAGEEKVEQPAKAGDGAAKGEKPAKGDKPAKGGKKGGGAVYVVAPDGLLRRIPVKVGTSDGTFTAVEPREAGALEEGADVVTAIVRDAEEQQANPFMPQMPGRGSGGGRGGR